LNELDKRGGKEGRRQSERGGESFTKSYLRQKEKKDVFKSTGKHKSVKPVGN